LIFKEFGKVVDQRVEELQEHFKDGLEDKCRVGAANVSHQPEPGTQCLTPPKAADAAVATSDQFANSMHWATYRASEWSLDMKFSILAEFYTSSPSTWVMAPRSQR
jgi:hypothetical protein